MKIQYEEWRPGDDAQITVLRANRICDEYQEQGYDLTLRQLYYQFVSRDWLPNTQKSYDKLGQIVNRARLAGLLDWDRITDRTRNLKQLPKWRDPASIINVVAKQFHVDMWIDQPLRVEIWVEKEALAGVIERSADQWDCPWFSCRGYVSQSEMWAAGQRIEDYLRSGQRCLILHLGDHDPSGIDMTRDIEDRLRNFVYRDLAEESDLYIDPSEPLENHRYDVEEAITDQWFGDEQRESYAELFEVRRIALNMDQVQQYNPPPNPAKITDSRAVGYIREHGRQSWELDALDPATLNDLIGQHVSAEIDHDLFDARFAAREAGRQQLSLVSRRWADVVQLVEGGA